MAGSSRGASDAPVAHPLISEALLDGLESEAGEAVLLIGELRAATGWDYKVLLRHLGCAPEKRIPPTVEVPGAERMSHSLAFLKWVVAMTRQVDRTEDTRDIVLGAYELCHGSALPVADRVARCENSMSALCDGVSANDLIELGEIVPAFRTAALALGRGPVHDRAVRLGTMTAGLEDLRLTGEPGAPSVHLHPRRLRWLNADDTERAEHLGLRVALRMSKHLELCTRCAAFAAQLGVHGGPRHTAARAA